MSTLRWRLAWVSAAVILLGASPPAWAGHPQERRGFWIGLGIGYGSAGLGCDGCGDTEREGSFTGNVELGGTLNDHALLGVETNAWIKESGSTTLTLGSVTGNVTFYPTWTMKRMRETTIPASSGERAARLRIHVALGYPASPRGGPRCLVRAEA